MSATTEQNETTESAEQESAESAAAPDGPRIEVLGDASPEQVAALVAVLSGLGGGEEEAPAAPPSRWSSPERLVRGPVHASFGGWAASALPR